MSTSILSQLGEREGACEQTCHHHTIDKKLPRVCCVFACAKSSSAQMWSDVIPPVARPLVETSAARRSQCVRKHLSLPPLRPSLTVRRQCKHRCARRADSDSVPRGDAVGCCMCNAIMRGCVALSLSLSAARPSTTSPSSVSLQLHACMVPELRTV